MSRKAFTLVELLVVIAIIGLLSTIAVVSLGSARTLSRNAKRIADTQQLATTLALIYNEAGSYPNSSTGMPVGDGGWVCVSADCSGAWDWITGSAVVNNAITPYLTPPTDPTGGTRLGGGYFYNSQYVSNVAPFDGSAFPAGVVLQYNLESSTAPCTLGRKWSSATNTSQCILYLE